MDTSSPNVSDDDEVGKGPPSWLRDVWGQRPTTPPPLARTSSRTTLPVWHNEGRVVPTSMWLKESHTSAGLSALRGWEEAQEAELARATQNALEIAQAASRELLNDLHDVTKSLGFWETKLHDTPRRLWWFLLLQTGPGHFYGTLFSSVRNLLNSCSSLVRNPGKEGRRLPPISTGLRKAYISPHLQVDGKVRVLSSMQFSLASAVGEVHRHAGNVANAWNSERADAESLRKLLHDALTGLLGSLQAVSKSKTLPSSSTGLDDSPKLSQSPLSKAVNTAFSPRHSRLGERGKAEGLAEVRANEFHGSSTDAAGMDEGIKEIRRLIRKLELEGSKASANAKAVIAANTRPRQWQRSKLCGSSDLDNFIQSLWSSLLRFWNTHAVTPWREIKSELSKAFDQTTDVVGLQQLESSKASLDRMLEQYIAQATRPGYSAPLYRAYRAVAGGSSEQGVQEPPDPFALVTARVEEELKSPLQNMLGGDLMQLLLIQTQVMKVDMESALLQMDQIMRANRLNFSLMAGMPALLAGFMSTSLGSTSLGVRTHRRRTQNREDMRMLLAEAERALTELQYSDNKSFASGMLLYALNTLFQSVQRHRQYFSPAEWRAVRADIMTLSDNDVPIESKSRVVSRLARIKAFIPEPHRVPNI